MTDTPFAPIVRSLVDRSVDSAEWLAAVEVAANDEIASAAEISEQRTTLAARASWSASFAATAASWAQVDRGPTSRWPLPR